jgi:hypothetical protein
MAAPSTAERFISRTDLPKSASFTVRSSRGDMPVEKELQVPEQCADIARQHVTRTVPPSRGRW